MLHILVKSISGQIELVTLNKHIPIHVHQFVRESSQILCCSIELKAVEQRSTGGRRNKLNNSPGRQDSSSVSI